MKIAVITDEGSKGGAAIAATRLCVGLRRQGHHVVRLHRKRFDPAPGSYDEVRPIALRPEPLGRVAAVVRAEWWRRRAQHMWVEQFRRTLADVQPDVINIHNIHGARWDIEVVEECVRHAPVVWTLHDMWPITGSCAYSMDCMKFKTACDRACPELGEYPTLPAGQIAASHERRREFYAAAPPLVHVAPSRWLAGLAESMTRGTIATHCIPYGLNLDQFKPGSSREARGRLGLPVDGSPVALVSSASLAIPRKGLALLVEALEHGGRDMLSAGDKGAGAGLHLVFVGEGGPDWIARLGLPDWVQPHFTGRLEGAEALATAYNAADLFIHPSLADNLPLVLMEASACATPSVGLPIGGVPEMIEDGETGWLAREATAKGLAEALGRAFSDHAEWTRLGREAGKFAQRHYALEKQVRAYEKLFEQMISRSGR